MTRKRPHRGNTRRGRTNGPRRRPQQLILGTIHITRPDAARVETSEGTYVVARGSIHGAMDGDEVQISLERRGGTERKAVVRAVVRRATSTFLGTFSPAGPLGAVMPLDGRMSRDFFVLPEDTSVERLGVAEGDVVEARILDYPGRDTARVVTLERRVGAAGELDLLVETVIASHGLATAFPPRVLEQAEGLRLDVEAALAQPGRADMRDTVAFTIDPTDARDFDDAVSAVVDGQGGYTVMVHIADVTHYLGWDSPMDIEARQRTCSVYLVDRVLPMLPERLCNELCSLRPDEDRLAMSVTLRLNERCEVTSAQMTPSVIRSRARLDYAGVDAVLEGRAAATELPCELPVAEEVAGMIMLLDRIAQARRQLRARRGSVDFETRESKVTLDEKGRPVDVVVRERTRATSLIEEAMLMANEAVADLLAASDVPAAYRVHERPAPESLAETLPALHELRLLELGETDRLVAGDPYVVQDVLERAKGAPGGLLASELLLRAQKRAIYLPHNEGHYALGARAYCHFTSPIRRYPDVIVHRALKALLSRTSGSSEQREVARALPQLCRTCSERERVADAAARDSQKVKMAELFAGRVGERFSGVVTGCERYGLFVMLDETCAEGLVPVRSLGDEWFFFDERHRALVGEESGQTYRLGQHIVVEVTGANPARGQIDFRPAVPSRPAGQGEG